MKGFLTWIVLVASACGGKIEGQDDALTPKTPEELCKSASKIECEKIYACFSDPMLDAFKAQFGPDAASCAAHFEMQCNTSGACPSGGMPDYTRATQCLKDFKALECESFMSGVIPPSCFRICF